MQYIKKNLANAITVSRIVCSALLLLVPVFSIAFYVVYLAAGLSDIADGIVARKTGSTSEFGSKLDTIADFIFTLVCFIKLLPALNIPLWAMIWTACIAVLKCANFIAGFAVNGEMTALHNTINRLTGCLLYLLPLTVSFLDSNYYLLAVGTVATMAALQEGFEGMKKMQKM